MKDGGTWNYEEVIKENERESREIENIETRKEKKEWIIIMKEKNKSRMKGCFFIIRISKEMN